MAATPLFTCTCGVQKKTSNHWILAITSAHDVKFMPWDANLALQDNVIVLCGERCAAALLSRLPWRLEGLRVHRHSGLGLNCLRQGDGNRNQRRRVTAPLSDPLVAEPGEPDTLWPLGPGCLADTRKSGLAALR